MLDRLQIWTLVVCKSQPGNTVAMMVMVMVANGILLLLQCTFNPVEVTR